MNEEQSLGNQQGWCITTQDHLNDLNMELKSVARQYQTSIDELKCFNYIPELLPYLETLCSEFETTIDGVVDYIEEEHVAYINGRLQTVSAMIMEELGLSKF